MSLEKKELVEEEEANQKKVIERVIVKEEEYRPAKLELEDLKPKYMDRQQRYNNWYFAANFTHDGRDYLVKFSIREGTLMGQNKIFLSLSTDPLILKQEGDVQVVQEPVNDIDIVKPLEDKDFKYTEDNDKIRIEMDELTAMCRVDEWKIVSRNKRLGADLTFTPRGPSTFWGGEKNAVCEITENTRVSGIETLSNFEGNVIIDGKEIEVQGRGLFERVWIGSLNFLEIRLVDWIVANFDQMYTFLCHVESDASDGRPFHFETGTVHLVMEDDYMVAKKLEVIPEKWVYLRSAYRFIPYTQRVKVETDKGSLEMMATLSMYPQPIDEPRRIENLTINNITGWSALFYDAPVKLEGKFTYKNGKTVKLTNGVGINEVLRILPL
ncbi:MAG: hypothetical protein ACTSP1_07715 [Candidatus Freyarchaeota archaeon]